MAIIRQKKKRIILSALIGALSTGIPMVIIFVAFLARNAQMEEKYDAMKKMYNSYKKCQVYVLSCDIKKGQIIVPQNVQQRYVTIQGEYRETKLSDIVGSAAKCDLKKNDVVYDSLVYKNGNDNLKNYYLTCFDYLEGIEGEGLYDIHIRYANGEDYVVVSGKRADRSGEQGINMYLTNSEAKMLSSARADRDLYEGTVIYLSGYAGDFQDNEKTDYPINKNVLVWFSENGNQEDTEKINMEQACEKRGLLEERLFEYERTVSRAD